MTIHDELCQRPAVSLGPIPAPDYTMRVGKGHEPLPDRNTKRVTTVTQQYGIRWCDDALNERISWAVEDPDYYAHRNILSDPVLQDAGPVKVTRTVTYTEWEEQS